MFTCYRCNTIELHLNPFHSCPIPRLCNMSCLDMSILENPLPTWVPHIFLICFQHLPLPPTLNHCIVYILLLPLALFPVSICQLWHIDTGESSPLLGPSSPLDLLSTPPPFSYCQPLHTLHPVDSNGSASNLHLPVGNLPGDPIPWTMVLHHAKDSIPQKIRNYDLIQEF